MFVERKRLLSLAALFTLTILLAGTWWILSEQNEPGEQKVAAGSAPAGMERSGFIAPATPGPVEPVVVDLSSVAPGQFDPNNKYARWLKGKVDFSKRNRIVSADRIKSLKNASPQLVPSFDVQVADDTIGPSAPSPDPASTFDSLDYLECCGGGGNVPPDPEMAAGPNHLIAVVNVAFEIYDKNGTTLQPPTTFESFMSANPDCPDVSDPNAFVFDPNALYDEEADRFILGVATNGGFYCAAVSQTGDPTGLWNIYAFQTASGAEFFDYPHAGVGRDAIYVGSNIFEGGFKEGRIFALDKTAMYAGDPAIHVTRGLGSTYDSSQPLNLHGWNQGTWPNSGPHYFFSDRNYNGRTYAIHSWADPFGANTLTEVGVVDLNAATGVTAGFPLDVPQSGGGTVDGGDWRPQDFEYRNGFGWTAMAIACNPGGGTVNCVRWAQIDLSTRTVADAGVYASDGTYRSYADLAANDCGDMAVGYTKSSSAMYPGIWYTGRLSSDPAGILQPESELKAGEITYTSFERRAPRRWGDYTGMTIDPDGDTFWYLGEYSKDTGTTNGRWGTYIGSFSFGCDATATPDTEPPVRSNGQPSGSLPAGTIQATLALSTNENATCRYGTVANTDFASMATTFGITGGQAHQSTVNGLVDGQSYNFFVRCQDDALNINTDDFGISFSVAAAGTPPSVTSIGFVPSAVAGTVSGAVTITATATDDTAVVRVEFFIGVNSLFVDTNAGDGWSAAWNTASGAYSDGPYTVKAVATDNDGNIGQLSIEVTVSNNPGATTLHIADLDGAATSSGKNWQANVTATVRDNDNQPVDGAEVVGAWSGDASGPANCTTDASGTCDVTTGNIPKKQTNSAVFTVTGITHASLTYDSTANWDPDGDSSGTAIQVNKDGTTLIPGNQPPGAGFSFTIVSLTASFTDQSSDSDGTIFSWSWTFGDGGTSTAQNPSHAYATAGMYSVSLTVTDNDGATGIDTQTVPVGVIMETMHIVGLNDSSSPGKGSRWNAGVTVAVRHSNGDPVLTATVSGSWSEGANGSASCDTDATGQCELVKKNVKSNVASVKLSITGVTHPSLTYDESGNPPEIGNTPVITVIKP